MAENNSVPLPNFETLDELVDYFDNHDLGDHWEEMPEMNFEIEIQTKSHLFALDNDLIDDLSKIARKQHTSLAKLINLWLKEKLAE
jgi:CopG antitoxin of type II toxin-antitoxin system